MSPWDVAAVYGIVCAAAFLTVIAFCVACLLYDRRQNRKRAAEHADRLLAEFRRELEAESAR